MCDEQRETSLYPFQSLEDATSMEIPALAYHDILQFDSNSYTTLFDCLQAPLDYGSVTEPFALFLPEVEDQPVEPRNSSSAAPISPASAPSSFEVGADEEKSVQSGKSKQNDKVKEDGSKERKEKKAREPRFAFMTKSEVDLLEDGYRWRKYGQKAVKHSPYPRSYYRCTTQKCMVKKRVQRSYEDPSIVIHTYEGQHNHPIPSSHRGMYFNSHVTVPTSSMMDQPPLRFHGDESTAENHIIPRNVNHETLDYIHQLFYSHSQQSDNGLF